MKVVVLGLCAFMLSAVGLSAQDGVLDPIYFEWGIDAGQGRQFLYPEVQYDDNPAVLVELEDGFLRPTVYFDRDFSSEELTATEESVNAGDDGEEGAQESEEFRSTDFTIRTRAFNPVDDGLTVGADAQVSVFNANALRESDEQFDAGNTFESEEISGSSWFLRGTGYGAISLEGVDLGLRLGATIFRRPGEDQYIETVDAGTTTVDVFGDDGDYTSWTMQVTPGARFDVGDGIFGVGLGFEYGRDNYVEWLQDPNDASQIIAVTDQQNVDDALNERVRVSLSLNPTYEVPLTETVRFISSNSLTVLDSETEEVYERVNADDENLETFTQGASFPSFSLGAGVAWETRDWMELRTGLEVGRTATQFGREFLDVNGEEAGTQDGLEEVNLGADPSDQAIVGEDIVTEERATTLSLEHGLTLSPEGPLHVFMGGGIDFVWSSELYEVYNLDEDAAVSAELGGNDAEVNLNATAGYALELGESLLLSMDGGWIYRTIFADRAAEDDFDGDRERTRVGSQNNIDGNGNFRISLNAIFRF